MIQFGTNSVTDSPGANYAPNAFTTSTSPRFTPPADATLCDVGHDRRRRLEPGDFFGVAASNDDGLSYFDIERLDTDSVGPGLRSTPDPPRFRTDGSAATRVQFWLDADGDAITDDGVYVDNARRPLRALERGGSTLLPGHVTSLTRGRGSGGAHALQEPRALAA